MTQHPCRTQARSCQGTSRKKMLISGGASGIGLATVTEFAREGACVAIFDVNQTAGRNQADQLTNEGYNVRFFHVDVTSPEQIQDAVATFAEENHGHIHHLVNGGLLCLLIDSTDSEKSSIFSGLLRLERSACYSE